ncbi:hypothetical protein [Streptomyces sp. NPDC086182]|uniref:hypothetical protein n=1 Tax=Streptomyces sp. NPDC086182 TaxID=3155058 RepID=UPI00341D0454
MAIKGEGVFAGLNAEWALTCAEEAHVVMVRGWLEHAGVFQPGEAPERLDELLVELERRDRNQGRRHSDRWMSPLLSIAAGAGAEAQLAARVVVQAMLPGAFRMARRLTREGRDFDEVGQVVVASMYRVVRNYPQARHQKVAANVLLETLHLASRELRADHEPNGVAWYSGLATVPADCDVADEACRSVISQGADYARLAGDAEEPVGPRGELIELVLWGVSVGLIGAERAQAIAGEVQAGGWERAEEAGISAVAWRKRRSRMVRQLRVVAEAWVRAA